MKKSILLRFIVLVAVFVMAFIFYKYEDQSAKQESHAVLPIVDEPITIKIWAPLHSNHELAGVSSLKDVLAFKELERRTNIKVDWTCVPSKDSNKLFQLMISSRSLPDAFLWNSSPSLELANQQAITNLDELVEMYASNFRKILELNSNFRKDCIDADNKLWSISQYNSYTELSGLYIPFQIRRDWLKNLELQEPQTPDEWYRVLKAFKTQDPNRNGQADEIPYSFTGIDPILLFWSHGIVNGYYHVDGVVKYGPIEPEYKKGLEFGYKLLSEGLLDPDFMTQSTQQVYKKVQNNIVGATRGNQHIISGDYKKELSIKGINYDMWVVPYMKAADGKRYGFARPFIDNIANVGLYIANSSKYKKEIIKWIDYQYSDEGSLLMTYGVNGKSFDISNGIPELKSDIMVDSSGKYSLAYRSKSTAAGDGTFSWPCHVYNVKDKSSKLPRDVIFAMGDKQLLDDSVKIRSQVDASRILPLGLRFYINYESTDSKTELENEIWNYVSDMTLKFLTGKEPLSDFDRYVARVKEMKIDVLIKNYQNALDKYNKR